MNANNPMTPGVYTVEKNAFPPSVVAAPTAIPAFIGYTEKAIKNGKSLHMKPLMIESLSEFAQYFGGAPETKYPIEQVIPETPGMPPAPGTYDFYIAGKYYKVGDATSQLFYLFNCLRLFFMNGGGQCYIVSVGTYLSMQLLPGAKEPEELPTAAEKSDLLAGLETLREIPFPKPTMILIPDGLVLGKQDNLTVQQEMLAQCGELMDRVAVMDIYNGNQGLTSGVIEDFRNGIGIGNLKYGAVYYPWLECNVVDASEVTYANVDQDSPGSTKMSDLFPGNPAIPVLDQVSKDLTLCEEFSPIPAGLPKGLPEYPSWDAAFNGALASDPNGVISHQGAVLESMYQLLWDLANNKGASTAHPQLVIKSPELIKAIGILVNPQGALASLMVQLANYDKNFPGGTTAKVEAKLKPWGLEPATNASSPYKSGATANEAFGVATIFYKQVFKNLNRGVNAIVGSAKTLLNQYNTAMENSNATYKHVMQALAKEANILPPASAMAGIYSLVDNTLGVWNAPANVNIMAVVAPTVSINDEHQASLNVDALAGKSINAIRSFYGRGPAIVWGARTLDGNSNDWRYINVRRTMILIEQSVQNAAFSLVFKPNDAVTWNTCEGMVSNFLRTLWANGALQGKSPGDAYSVSVGLGKTMSPQDILEGIMRVTVKVAVVRPAEFIIFTYEQQMAKSG